MFLRAETGWPVSQKPEALVSVICESDITESLGHKHGHEDRDVQFAVNHHSRFVATVLRQTELIGNL